MDTLKNTFVKLYTTYKKNTSYPYKVNIRGRLDDKIIISLTYRSFQGGKDLVEASTVTLDEFDDLIDYYYTHMDKHSFEHIFPPYFFNYVDYEVEQMQNAGIIKPSSRRTWSNRGWRTSQALDPDRYDKDLDYTYIDPMHPYKRRY